MKYQCHCDPRTVAIQEYQRSVPVTIPPYIRLHRNATGQEERSVVCIDACLISEVWELWRRGIRTTGCCCGHNQVEPYIGVAEEDIDRMIAMGYEIKKNLMDESRKDSFYPKSLLAPEVENILAGIDKDELQGGWWETSAGVEFGVRKLNEIQGALQVVRICECGNFCSACRPTDSDIDRALKTINL